MDCDKIFKGDASGRDARIEDALRELGNLDPPALAPQLRSYIEAEYTQDDNTLREISHSRLKALLALDDESARRVAEAYDNVMNDMPGDIAFRRAAVVQSLARLEFSVEDEDRLRSLVPNVFGDKPREVSVGTPGPQEPVDPYPKRRWRTFWQRKKAESR